MAKLLRLTLLTVAVLLILGTAGAWAQSTKTTTAKHVDPRLAKAYRFERDHWIYVHLQGSPSEIGYQHGYLLAPEIADAFNAVKIKDTHRTKRDWAFFRETAEKVLWPHIETEYRQELQGITDGLKARGVKMDLWDVVALNAMEEVPDYYIPWLERTHQQAKREGEADLTAPGNCSAFVATGSWTKDGKPVMAHNTWTSVISGSRWRIIFDIVPQHGYHFIMDGFPGIIVSDDDFGINSAGLMITETTITGFASFDPNGIPEFVRARKAMQYANSIDSYVKIMTDGNNGGYANDWLLADTKTGEIARFELGLKFHKVWTSKNGYFVGSNFPSDPQFIKTETNFNPANMASSMNARHKRWDELMAEYKGRIDVTLAKQFLADHYDTYEKRIHPDERTLCGHVDVSPRGVPEWGDAPYTPEGAVTAKAADAAMAKSLEMWARAGRPCGEDFIASKFLKEHPEYNWQKSILPDMKGNPWAEFRPGEKK